jgi:hypothetical protein
MMNGHSCRLLSRLSHLSPYFHALSSLGGKAVPQHTYGRAGRRLGIAPTHSRRGWVVSITPRPRFTSRERIPGTHWTGGWVDPGNSLYSDVEEKSSYLCRGWIIVHPVFQYVVRHYTDLATLLLQLDLLIYIYADPVLNIAHFGFEMPCD